MVVYEGGIKSGEHNDIALHEVNIFGSVWWCRSDGLFGGVWWCTSEGERYNIALHEVNLFGGVWWCTGQ